VTLFLVRHGETTWNRDGKIQGWADSSLTEPGRRQARAVGARLAAEGVDRLVVSDLQRTRETAAVLGEAGVEVAPMFERAWRERDFGEYRGLTRAEVATRHDHYDPDGSLVAIEDVPEGELLDDFEERVRAGLDAVAADLDGDETAVVVTHSGAIRAAVAAVTGRDLGTLAREWSPDNCGLTAIECVGDRSIRFRDDTAHLD